MRVLMPLPDNDFDVTEVAVPWKVLSAAGHEVVFATQRAGTLPAGDPRLLTGVLFGRLGAADEPKEFYEQLTRAAEFHHTIAWSDIEPGELDGLLLPGGHAAGMRQYLGSPVLRTKVAEFCKLGPRVVTKRGTDTDDAPAFVVEDGNYVSARWPGDAYLFAKRFRARLDDPD